MRSTPRSLQRTALKGGGDGGDVPGDLRRRFGVWLRERRLELGMVQRELAQKTDHDSVLISVIETGRGSIPPERYSAYAAALDMTEADFAKVVLRHVNPWLYKAIFHSRERDLLDDVARIEAAAQDPPKRN